MQTYKLPNNDFLLTIGNFQEKTYDKYFDYISSNNIQSWDDTLQATYPHMVCVNDPVNPWRYARVLKTVVYILCEDGEQKWDIKSHRNFK